LLPDTFFRKSPPRTKSAATRDTAVRSEEKPGGIRAAKNKKNNGKLITLKEAVYAEKRSRV
jgi:hypothetical protein